MPKCVGFSTEVLVDHLNDDSLIVETKLDRGSFMWITVVFGPVSTTALEAATIAT